MQYAYKLLTRNVKDQQSVIRLAKAVVTTDRMNHAENELSAQAKRKETHWHI